MVRTHNFDLNVWTDYVSRQLAKNVYEVICDNAEIAAAKAPVQVTHTLSAT